MSHVPLKRLCGSAGLRLAREHQHDLAGDVETGVVAVAILRRVDAVAGEHQRRRDVHVDAALPCQREVGGQARNRGRSLPPLGGDRRAQLGLRAVDDGLRHREVLEVGPAVADWLQAQPVKESGDVVGGDAPFEAQRVAAAHLRCGQEEDVTLERVGADRAEAGVDRLRRPQPRSPARARQPLTPAE